MHEDKDTQTTESFTSINKCLTEFQDGTVQKLENTFVNAIDNFAKAHNHTTDLQNQIRKLTQERDALKAQKNHIAPAPEATKCNCLTLQTKVQDLEKEAEKLGQTCSDLRLNKEIELSKIQSSTTVIRQKYESTNTQLNILQQEVDTIEKRLKLKNDVILELEEKAKKTNLQMLTLQDELLSWKLHASRQDDTLIQQTKDDKVVQIHENSTGEEDKNTDRAGNITPKPLQNMQDDVIDVDEIPDKKTVLLIGTSNLKYINTSMMSNQKVKIEKEIKFTLKEGQEYVDAIKSDNSKVDAFVLHLFENDITEETPEYCSEKLSKICADIQKKSNDAKIIVSMGLPRGEEIINRKISKLNVLLQDKLGDMKNVTLCDNGNLFYRGQQARGVLGQDGKHLSRLGTTKLGANLKASIYEVLGESKGKQDYTSNGNMSDDNRQSGNRNGGNRSGGHRSDGSRSGGYRSGGYRNGGYRNGSYRRGGYRDGGYRNGSNSSDGYRDGGDRNGGYRDSGDRDSGDRNGGYRDSGNRDAGDWNGGYQDGGKRDGGNRNGGNRDCGNRNQDYRNGGYRDDAIRSGGYRDDNYQDGGYRDGGDQYGGNRNGSYQAGSNHNGGRRGYRPMNGYWRGRY